MVDELEVIIYATAGIAALGSGALMAKTGISSESVQLFAPFAIMFGAGFLSMKESAECRLAPNDNSLACTLAHGFMGGVIGGVGAVACEAAGYGLYHGLNYLLK